MRLTRFLCVRYTDLGELTKKFANFPETYMKRRFEVVEYKTPRGFPQYRARTMKRMDYYLAEHRPWREEYRMQNEIGQKNNKIWVEPIKNWSIFKGDLVEILVGKDKGKQGTVVQVIQERNWVYVEGLNCEVVEFGKTKTSPGVFMKQEKPLLVTNEVALVDPHDMKPVKIEWRYTETGVKVRVSMRSGRIIPVPVEASETLDYKEKHLYVGRVQRGQSRYLIAEPRKWGVRSGRIIPLPAEASEMLDYKKKHLYVESPKDTKAADVEEVTFEPALQTFEMDIAKQHGIQDDRVPARTFWY